VSVAGVHVYSPRFGVAALGNVATKPSARGRGLGTAVCGHLCHLLQADGISTISLNVRADNRAAIGVYERLGFNRAAEYLEVSLG
jgi:ribosomal protein S18 acetylase RimI-like enzyme